MASSVPCCADSVLFAGRGAIGAVAAGFTEIGDVTGLSAGAASVSVRLLKIKYAASATAAPINPADTDSADAYGDTEAQALSIFTKMKAQLAEMGLTMGDMVKLTVFLVGDPKNGGKMDRDGLTRAYKKFFGTADQPNLPTRSAFQISALARPQQLIEIEGIAAKAP